MGFRGYISSREFGGQRVPQHIQNLVIRDYCKRKGIDYLLSATELAMPETYIMLTQLREQVDEIDGIVFKVFSNLRESFKSEKYRMEKKLRRTKEKKELKSFTKKEVHRHERLQ